MPQQLRPTTRADLGAVVLCGGRSSRMGRPKAWLDFGGEPLLVRVVRRLAGAADPIVVVAAPGQDLPPLPPAVEILRDPVEDEGPLVGLGAGLAALASRAAYAFVSAVDAPFLAPELVRRLRTLCADADACVVRDGDHLQALAAVFATGLHPTVEALVAAGERRALAVFERARTVIVERGELLADPAVAAADPELWSFRNLNTPADYAAALRDAAF
jgi:molybdenum cofactor guanylyltransferase